MTLHQLLPLIGIPIVIAGFLVRLNPLFVVVAAGIVTALAAGMAPLDLLAVIGDKFLASRQLTLFLLVLPVVGLLERNGLRERAQSWIATIHGASAGRILLIYLIAREASAAVGLVSLGSQAGTVRPLLAPMAEGAAAARLGPLPAATIERVRAHAAAVENVSVFFGEDIFIAFGAVLLMDAFLKGNGITDVEPLAIGLWAMPTALAALVIHGVRLLRFDASLSGSRP